MEPPARGEMENWTVELDCGHRVHVALEEGPLVVMAHLAQHHAACPGVPGPWAPEFELGWPLPFRSGATSR